MRRLATDAVLTTMLAWALFELYLVLRPPDLTERFHAFLETAHGRFEQFYAERRDRPGEASDAAPLGE